MVGGQNIKKTKNFMYHAQTPVGARRLMKAILLRHILLKKTGQAGFMMKCSRRIRSSVNKVLGWKYISLVLNSDNAVKLFHF